MRYTLLLLVICLVHSVTGYSAEKPNILFLFTDDQRADTIAALGNPVIETPNLDRLVNTGYTFHNAYCFGANSGAVCFPSRNMLLSGRVYFHHDYKPRGKGGAHFASPEKANFADSMKSAGYETYHHGKQGNTANYLHERFEHSKYLNEHKERLSVTPGKTITDDAIEFLKQRATDRPFCMYLAFGSPHDPRVASKKYLNKYPLDQIPLPKNYLPMHPFNNGEMAVRDEKLEKWPRTKEAVRRHLRDYYAVITHMDEQYGRLFETLEELGEFDNTIVVFSSDHGLAIGSHGLFGKQSLYEHSMKAPLILSGPGIKHGESDALVYLHDIYPSLCEFAGAEQPEGLDGVSFRPVMTGEADSVRDSLFTSYQKVQRAYRNDRWKIIRYPQINRTQLFDLQNDPHETHDLAALPEHQQRIEEMLQQMHQWQQDVGDTLPLTSGNPQDEKWTPPVAKSNK
ncbi:sulfatase-like hydrolase/transferase [Calycomorphotria hydatis]|nr:sulfatase-like hydrolase/transferase [Calycomorphotria hydatis]